MKGNRISYHESVRKVYGKIKKDGMNNIWDRYEAQGFGEDPDKRCPFCTAGVRCDLCSNGPCRADASKDKRGVCGITADGMAMRKMLLKRSRGIHLPLPHRADYQNPSGNSKRSNTVRDKRT